MGVSGGRVEGAVEAPLMDRRAFVAGALGCLTAAGAALFARHGTAWAAGGASEKGAAAEPVEVRVAALKGPTAMGMVRFMDLVDAGEVSDNDYTFEICATADEITPQIARGAVDIAAVPANLASVLYNNADRAVEVLAIDVLGVLYVCETGDTVHSVADLAGKTVYASGRGSTPQYAFEYILRANGIDPERDLTIEWCSEQTECAAALAQENAAVAMLPQPFVTTAQAQNPAIRVTLDLTEEWDAVQRAAEPEGGSDGEGGGAAARSALVTGVVVARREFADAHPQTVAAFLGHLADSAAYVNEEVADAAQLVERYGIVTAEVAERAIPACSIVCIAGEEMKAKLGGYLAVLYGQNPTAVGGALPEDDFYYLGA